MNTLSQFLGALGQGCQCVFLCVRKDLWFLLQDCQCWAPLWAPCFPAGAASGSQRDDELWSLKLSAAAGSICSLLDYCRHKERGRDSMRKIKVINAGMTVFLNIHDKSCNPVLWSVWPSLKSRTALVRRKEGDWFELYLFSVASRSILSLWIWKTRHTNIHFTS